MRQPEQGTLDRGSRDHPDRPSLATYEEEWLDKFWDGDKRELRRGRYLQQQRDLQHAFENSSFLREVKRLLQEWSAQYQRQKNAPLFAAMPAVELNLKPWESFLSRTRRVNVVRNENWPGPPPGGWLLPDSWFERLWDIVRMRLVVRYLDGVQFLSEELMRLARREQLEVRRKTHAQDVGYYAMHVVVSQEFAVQTLNYEETETRRSGVEIQVTTELQEAIGRLTHNHFEKRREEIVAPDQKWQWDYRSPEFTPYYLGHLLHYLEGMVMRVRDEVSREQH